MDRSDFFLADGSINMNAARSAAHKARADVAKTGFGGVTRLFRRPARLQNSDLR